MWYTAIYRLDIPKDHNGDKQRCHVIRMKVWIKKAINIHTKFFFSISSCHKEQTSLKVCPPLILDNLQTFVENSSERKRGSPKQTAEIDITSVLTKLITWYTRPIRQTHFLCCLNTTMIHFSTLIYISIIQSPPPKTTVTPGQRCHWWKHMPLDPQPLVDPPRNRCFVSPHNRNKNDKKKI